MFIFLSKKKIKLFIQQKISINLAVHLSIAQIHKNSNPQPNKFNETQIVYFVSPPSESQAAKQRQSTNEIRIHYSIFLTHLFMIKIVYVTHNSQSIPLITNSCVSQWLTHHIQPPSQEWRAIIVLFIDPKFEYRNVCLPIQKQKTVLLTQFVCFKCGINKVNMFQSAWVYERKAK